MRSSAISSATETNPSPTGQPATPTRSSFALTGPSRALDPKTNAVRPDIADVRLAEYVFAPHYAAPMPRMLVAAATMTDSRAADAASLAELAIGETFDVLDVTGGTAWGIATAQGLVGYIPASALGIAG